jgi:ankyrin repeat protein
LDPNFVAGPEYADWKGNSLIGLAYSQPEMLALLLQKGADREQAAVEALKVELLPDVHKLRVVKTLVDNGVNLSGKLKNGATVFRYLCYSPTSIRYLLSLGIRPISTSTNPDERSDNTALGRCLSLADSERERLVKVRSSRNIDQAVVRHLTDTMSLELDSAKILALTGVDLDASERRLTLLHWAYKQTNKEIFEIMLAQGASVTYLPPSGVFVLHAAAESGDAGAVKKIIATAREQIAGGARSKEDVERLLAEWANTKLNGKSTALHLAAQNGARAAVVELIAAGADISARDEDGKTAQALYDAYLEKKSRVDASARDAEAARLARVEEDAHQAEVNRQGAMAILGAVAIGRATSGSTVSEAQRSQLVDAFTRDRANAANGLASNAFSGAVDNVTGEMNFKRIAAAIQTRRMEEQAKRGVDQQRNITAPVVIKNERQRAALPASASLSESNWTTASSQEMLWSEAKAFCASSGRRLPSLDELTNRRTSGPSVGVRGITWTNDEFRDAHQHYAFDTQNGGASIGYEQAAFFENSRLLVVCVR